MSNTGYLGDFDAQHDSTWTSEWGGGSLPKTKHGAATLITGTPLQLNVYPGGPYDTYYQLRRMAAANLATVCAYHVAFQFPDDKALALAQAVEFEIQRSDGSHIINGGVQFDLKGSKMVRTYDFTLGHWVATPIPCDPTWLTHSSILDVVCVYDLAPFSITYRGLNINGVWHPLNITRPAVPKAQSPYLNFAYQLDCTASTSANALWIPACDIVAL